MTHRPLPHVRAWRTGALCACLAFLTAPAAAGKPSGPDHAAAEDRGHAPVQVQVQLPIGGYFTDGQRRALRSPQAPGAQAGKCPPGLAKKGNGCQPPGQAKKWQLGQRVPTSVVLEPVPRSVVVQIGLPPPGHEFVRVATDILLIAIGTRLVVDAIEDLSGF